MSTDTRARSYARSRPAELVRYPEPEETQGVLDFLERAHDALQGAYAHRGREGATGRLDHARRALADAIQEAREELHGPTPFEVLKHHLEHWHDQLLAWWEDREGAPLRPPPPWWKARQLVGVLGLSHDSDPPVR